MPIDVLPEHAQEPPKKQRVHRWLFLLFGAGISGGMATYLVQRIDLAHFIVIATEANLLIFPAIFGVYLLLNLFRALRFRHLLDQKHLPIKVIFPIALYHNFWVRTLPLFVGEFSYIALLRRYLKQSVSSGVSSLLFSRLFELLLVLLGGTIGLLVVGPQWSASHQLFTVLFPTLALITAGGIYFSDSLFKSTVRIFCDMVTMVPWSKPTFHAWVRQKLIPLSSQLEGENARRLFIKTFVFSCCTYGLSILFYLLLLESCGLNLSLGLSLAIISTVMIASWFPFTLSGFGVIEGSWAAGLVIFAGLDLGQGTSVGLFIHACQVLMTAISGMLGFVLLTWSNNFQDQISPEQSLRSASRKIAS